MNRRTYLKTGLTTGAIAAIAGCAGFGESEETDSDNGQSDDTGPGGDDEPGDESVDDELVGTFDDFEDLGEWEAFQGIGSIEADTDRSSVGSQSALLEPDDEGQVRVRRSLDEPIDVTNVAPGIAMTAETSSTVRIQLQDTDGDYYEFSQQVLDEMALTRKNFGITRIRGDPDLSDIIVLQVINWVDQDTDADRTWIDDFHFVPRPTSGKVMLQFHGGYEGHYEEALPILEEYDMEGTVFLATDRVRADQAVDGDRVTVDQVDELASAGWTIASNSATGTPLTDTDSISGGLESSITDAIDWLESEGYEDGARFFAFPQFEYDEASYELVQEYHELGFAGRVPSQGYAANPHLCSVTPSPDDPSEAIELLDWTAEYGGITSIPFFALDDEAAVTTLEETVSHLDELVSEDELEIITPQEMADEYVV